MRWATKLLAGALGAAASAIAAELLARRALRADGAYYRYRPHVRRRLHLDRSALPSLGPTSRFEINCDGERGGPPPRKNERAYRGLVVGGSAAECYFLDQDEGWGAVAERVLSEPARLRALGVDRIHIGNIARAILPCHELHRLLARVLPRYERLDTILIMVGASDVVSWLEAKMPEALPDAAMPLGSVFEQHPEGPFGFAPKRTALWQIASTARRRYLRPVEEMPKTGAWLHGVRAMRARATKRIDASADPTPMLDRFERSLRAILALCAAKARRVVLVRQPWLDATSPELEKLLWNFGVGRPYKEPVDVYCTPRLLSHLMSLADARAARVAAELGVEQIDLSPQLERSGRTFYDCLHFTPEGAEVIGRVVAARLTGPVEIARAPASAEPRDARRAHAHLAPLPAQGSAPHTSAP